MADGVNHPAQLRGIGTLHRLVDAAQAERLQRAALGLVRAVGRLDLGDQQAAHASTAGSGSTCESSTTFTPSDRPSTALTDRPRSCAISSGLRRSCRPAIVALTRLIGFCEPSDFDRMSWIPASSSTARTPPPAITPVPGEAGLRNTRPEP